MSLGIEFYRRFVCFVAEHPFASAVTFYVFSAILHINLSSFLLGWIHNSEIDLDLGLKIHSSVKAVTLGLIILAIFIFGERALVFTGIWGHWTQRKPPISNFLAKRFLRKKT